MAINPIDNPNEDTEFNDILRKHGILPAREEAPRTPTPPPPPSLEESIEGKTPDELARLAEEEDDSDTERVIEAYRRKRMAEIRTQEKSSSFGEVRPIGRDDYAREVTEASKADDPQDDEKGLGTGVAVVLYKDGDPSSVQLLAQLRVLAKRYPRTKFVSIVGNKCIENYPDRLQPTLILYRGGEVAAQVVSWGKDRVREPQELEALLVVSKVVSMVHRVNEDDVSGRPSTKHKEEDDIDSEEDIPSKEARGSGQPGRNQNVRGRTTVEDDDSDFDL